jgi:hypothetical protein
MKPKTNKYLALIIIVTGLLFIYLVGLLAK